MITRGDIFRRYGPADRARFGGRMRPRQWDTLLAIEQCRTQALGGHGYTGPAWAPTRYSSHSGRNRHGPRCQPDAAQAWLARQPALLRPVPYFMVPFTLPASLRAVARRHQRTIPLLFRTAAAALQQRAPDPRFLGGQIGMIGVLQTWTRALRSHPHGHYRVPALALAPDGQTWIGGHKPFLGHVAPLAQLFRAKFGAALRQTPRSRQVGADAWTQAWGVDCRPVGSGQAAVKDLAPYVFRGALSNNRIVSMRDEKVTVRYRDGETGPTKPCTLPVAAFIRRFLQHGLPTGFVQVRYDGLCRVGNRQRRAPARAWLGQHAAAGPTRSAAPSAPVVPTAPAALRCATCGQPMQWVHPLPPRRRAPAVVLRVANQR